MGHLTKSALILLTFAIIALASESKPDQSPTETGSHPTSGPVGRKENSDQAIHKSLVKIALNSLNDEGTILSKRDKSAVKQSIENARTMNGTLVVKYGHKEGNRKVNYEQKVHLEPGLMQQVRSEHLVVHNRGNQGVNRAAHKHHKHHHHHHGKRIRNRHFNHRGGMARARSNWYPNSKVANEQEQHGQHERFGWAPIY